MAKIKLLIIVPLNSIKMVSGNVETRNKKKGKFKEKKRNPYKKGGAQRSMNVSKKAKK